MKTTTLYAILAGAAILAGCSPEARQKYDQAGESMGSAAQKTTEAVATDAAKTGRAMKKGVEVAGEKTRDIAANATRNAKEGTYEAGEKGKVATVKTGNVLSNATQTMKVKTALMSAADVRTSNLNVDTIGRKVILKGSVPSQHQKARAGQIAQREAGSGWQVSNQLTVNGK